MTPVLACGSVTTDERTFGKVWAPTSVPRTADTAGGRTTPNDGSGAAMNDATRSPRTLRGIN